MNTIEIKTDLSGEKLQVLMWELEAFCEGKQLSKPVLRQADVSGSFCKCKKLNYSYTVPVCNKCNSVVDFSAK